MKKIVFLVLCTMIMAGVLFAGGGQQSNTSNAANANVLNIAIFEGGYGRAYWDDMVAKFEAAHPGVKVNMRIDSEIGNIIAPEIAVGNWPDFISISEDERSGVVASMIKNRELLDLTDVFNGNVPDRPGVRLRDIIVGGVLDSTSFSPYGDGKIYLAPGSIGPMGLVYNKTLFAQKGWKIPQTWDEFFALETELRKPENYVTINGQRVKRSLFTYQGIYAGYLESVFWPAIAGAGGLKAIDDINNYRQGSFLTQAVRDIVTTFQKIGTGGYLMEGTVALNHTQSQTDMMLGRALFIPNGLWMEGEMADAPREAGFEFAIAPTPTLRAGQDRYVLSSREQHEIPRQAKNPELAKEFLRFLYTRESITSFARLGNGILAVTDANDIAKPYLTSGTTGMMTAYDTGKFMLMSFAARPANNKTDIGKVVFDDTMGPLMTGRLTVDAYLNGVERAFAEIRADMAAAR